MSALIEHTGVAKLGKRTKELDPIRLRPHPHEFSLYYDN